MAQRIPSLKAIRLPKRMPTNFVLSKVAFPPSIQDLETKETPNGIVKPKLSFKDQWRIKKCSEFINEPTPIKLEHPQTVLKLQKGPKFPLTKIDRQRKISENMKRMDTRISDYIKERRKIKDSKKPELPF